MLRRKVKFVDAGIAIFNKKEKMTPKKDISLINAIKIGFYFAPPNSYLLTPILLSHPSAGALAKVCQSSLIP